MIVLWEEFFKCLNKENKVKNACRIKKINSLKGYLFSNNIFWERKSITFFVSRNYGDLEKQNFSLKNFLASINKNVNQPITRTFLYSPIIILLLCGISFEISLFSNFSKKKPHNQIRFPIFNFPQTPKAANFFRKQINKNSPNKIFEFWFTFSTFWKFYWNWWTFLNKWKSESTNQKHC